jgi:hypothetical protein
MLSAPRPPRHPHPGHVAPRARAAALALVLTASAAPASLAAQHVHGKGTLDIGLEGAAGRAVFRAPGDDVYGFEREPRTAAERATRDSALTRLRTLGSALLRFDPSFGCTVSADSVAVKPDRSGHGEVEARYAIACRTAPVGKPIRFGFSAAFPGVERVVVQLVTERTQTSATITRDRGAITP